MIGPHTRVRPSWAPRRPRVPIALGGCLRGGSMPHVLLVDDDEAFVAGLAAAVAAESFTTTVVKTLAEARAEIIRSLPDLLLLDIHLPDGNGLDLFKDMQSTSAEIVLMTGRASVETAVEALRRGASDYLVKPVDLARLRRVLANASRTRDLKA